MQDRFKGPLGLQGEQFWKKPLWQKSALDFRLGLVDKDIDGLFLDAPDRIYLARQRTLPLVTLRSGPTEKLHEFGLPTTTQVVVSHLETGMVRMVKLAESGPAGGGEKPSPGWTSSDLEVDLFSIMDLKPALGTFQAMLLCGPQVSNRKEFSIYPASESESTGETLAALLKLRKDGGLPAPLLDVKAAELRHAAPAKSYPANPVWKFDVGRELDGTLRMHLRFVVKALPRWMTPPGELRKDANGSPIRAVLPVLLVGFDEDRRLCLNSPIPSLAWGKGWRGARSSRESLSRASSSSRCRPDAPRLET